MRDCIYSPNCGFNSLSLVISASHSGIVLLGNTHDILSSTNTTERVSYNSFKSFTAVLDFSFGDADRTRSKSFSAYVRVIILRSTIKFSIFSFTSMLIRYGTCSNG